MAKDHKKHQQELAQSGYRVPDAFYVADPNATQASTEEASGDGGKAASEIDPADSEHGYKGETLTPEELAAAQEASGQKLGSPPVENKAASTTTATTTPAAKTSSKKK
jgi:hypothetical protein